MADYKGLNIRFRGDSTDASKALHILSAEAKSAQGNLNAVQQALGNAATNGKNLDDALKSIQLQQYGNAAQAASGKVDAYKQALVGLNERLQEAQQKLVTNRDALESMPAKYDALASTAKGFASSVQSSMAEVVAAQENLANTSVGTEEYEAAFQRLDDAVLKNVQNLSAEGEELNKVSATYGTLEGAVNAATESIRSTGAEIESTTTKMLVQESRARELSSEYLHLQSSMTGIGQLGTSVTEFGQNLEGVGNAISSIGDKMTVVSGIAAMTFGRNIISSTEEFGNAISQLGGYLDIQGAQLDEMSDQALKWGKDTQFSATEAAQAMNELAKGGMTQAQISGGAMEATMRLAAAGQLDMATAAETSVQAIKTFGLEAGNAAEIADALAGAANTSTAEVSDLANGFKYVGGWASMAGWNINDVSGALALLSDHGLKSEMAGTALRNVMQRLAAPTDTAAKLMEQYGFSVRDSEGHMVSAVEVVDRLNKTFGQLGDAEKQKVMNDIFGARALPAAVALMDEGAESLQGYIDSTEQAGYASEMAQSRMGELGWALEMLRGEAETAAVNFGTALTPTIKAAANAIEDALTWFNSLSDAEQTNIANMALMAAAAGPVISVIGHLASGIGGFVSSLGGAVSMLADYKTALDAGYQGIEALNAVQAGLGEKVEALATGSMAMLVAYVAGDVISTFSGLVEELNLVSDATDGIAESMSVAYVSFESYAAITEEAASSFATMVQTLSNANDALRSNAEFAESTKDTLSELGTNVHLVEEYANQMKELSSQGSLTAAQQEELKNAVNEYNDITGAAIEVTDSLHGTLNLLPGQIDEVTAAYRRQAEQQAYIDLYNDAIKQQAQNEEELARLTKQMGDAYADAAGKVKLAFDPFSQLQNLHVEADVIKLQQAMQGLKDSGEQLAFSVDYWKNKLDSIGDSAVPISSLETALASVGVTGEQTKNLTDRQLEELRAAFNVSIDSMIAKLREFGISAGDTKSTLANAAEDATGNYGNALENGIDESTEAAKKALQKQNDAIYKEAQKAFDKQYKALQKSLDAAYKAQQKAYDREYKELQKALDAEYDERQKAYDRAYKAQQDAYKDEEDALKKSLDAKLDALKDANEKAEKEYKRTLDAQYDARKKSLDADANALKKANDNQLKALKRSQKDRTDAFTKETNARIKEMDREYKAQLKLLERESGIDAIDSRIDQLQDETEAEKRALKEKERNEKESELRKAVEQAKTRRSRADAEKELSDYLEEIRVERNEEERKDEIERLKDQKELLKDSLDEKKEALKEQYDYEKEAYKEQRSEQLEAIKDADTLEYDALKEKLDAQLQARKDANSLELEALKQHNQDLLDAMKEQHEKQEEARKEAYDARLESMKDRHSEQLDLMKEQQKEDLDALKESHQSQLEALKESQQAQLESMKEGHQAQLDALKESQQAQLDALKESQQAALDTLDGGGKAMANTAQKHASDTKYKVNAEFSKLASDLDDSERKIHAQMLKNANQTDKDVNDTVSGAAKKAVNTMELAAPQIETAAGKQRDAAKRGLSDLPSDMEQSGKEASKNLASGLTSGEVSVQTASSSVAQTVKYEFDDSSWADTSGFDLIQNFVNGIYSGDGILDGALNWVAELVQAYLGHSVAKVGPLHVGGRGEAAWGEDLVENLAQGMHNAAPALMDETQRIASIISDPLTSGFGTNYSIGYDIKPMARMLTNGVTEALRSGVPQQRGVTVVVQNMQVRSESDIDRISERLYVRTEQARRRGW